MPRGYDIDWLIFVLCDGDITLSEKVEKFSYPQAVKWLQLKKYDNYMP